MEKVLNLQQIKANLFYQYPVNYDNDSLRKFLTILKKSLENTNFKSEKSLNELRTFYRYSCWQSLYDANDTYKNLCKNIKPHEQYEFFKLESGVFLIYCCKNIFDNVFQEKGYKDLIIEVKLYECLNENIKRKWAKLYPDSDFEPTAEAKPETEKTEENTVESPATNENIYQIIKAIDRKLGDERLDVFVRKPPKSWKNIRIGFDGRNILINGKSYTYKELRLPKVPKNNPECSTTGLFIKILCEPDRIDNTNERKKISVLNKILKSLTGLPNNPISGSGDTYHIKFDIDTENIAQLRNDYKNLPYNDNKSANSDD
ncbi:MAG: hypothetical protein JXB49_14480 [Bacteroidales bacterium]|nr:hypothetical protein [Bacteroidales bacterium]